MKLHRRITDEPITSDLIAHKGWVSKDFNGSKGIVLCLPDPFFLEVYHLEKRLKKQSQNATRNTKAIITAKNTQTKMQAKMEQLSRAFWGNLRHLLSIDFKYTTILRVRCGFRCLPSRPARLWSKRPGPLTTWRPCTDTCPSASVGELAESRGGRLVGGRLVD